MLKNLIQKKFILILLIISISLVLIFSFKTDLIFLKENLIQKLKKDFQVLAQKYTPYFFPRFPQRLIHLLERTEFSAEKLTNYSNELTNLLAQSNCEFSFSQCLPRIAFGGEIRCRPGNIIGAPYQNIKEVEEKKEEIADNIDSLVFLRELLEKEMEGGLEQELATLRRDEAEILKNNLERTLEKSGEIIRIAKENQEIYNINYSENCIAQCQEGPIQGFRACVMAGSGPQEYIELKAEVEVNVGDLELGEVGISEFGLKLPDKISFPELGDISLIIPSQSLQVCYPFQPINVSINPSPSANVLPLNLSLPEISLDGISSYYQCPQITDNGYIQSGAETSWPFKILSFLSEQCISLPGMTSVLGLNENAAKCYDQERKIGVIVNECNFLWNKYCDPEVLGSEPVSICKKIRYNCDDINGNAAVVLQCQNLFKQEELPIPFECQSMPIETLRNKCQELRVKFPQNPPEPCKILSIFTGEIEGFDKKTHQGEPKTCPPQKTLNVPFGFGSELGFNRPIEFPRTPRISLPDIPIRDIRLGEFNIPPFLRIKLPNIIIEDIILPDIELCDINNCSFNFPSLNFQSPHLRMPSFDISTPIPQLPGLDLRTRIELAEINLPFSSPQINLFNLLLPEINLPEINLPSPDFNFRITGIDLRGIVDLIFSFVINAAKIPEINACLTFRIPQTFLSIIFPDYYFSFFKFPEIPEIPFCKNINQFCRRVNNVLGEGGWIRKAREIETEFNKTVNELQRELDKINIATGKIQGAINETFSEIYGPLVYNAIIEQLRREGISLQDYINPRTREIDLNQIPFPGVFPIRAVGDRECLLVPVPQVDIILRIINARNYQETRIEKNLLSRPIQYIIYVPVDIPLEIPIPWPERLKNITLINDLSYDLPDISLSGLSYKREFPIKTVGFQPFRVDFDFGKITDGSCITQSPRGGNPFPMNQIVDKFNNIKNIKTELNTSSQTAIKILE